LLRTRELRCPRSHGLCRSRSSSATKASGCPVNSRAKWMKPWRSRKPRKSNRSMREWPPASCCTKRQEVGGSALTTEAQSHGENQNDSLSFSLCLRASVVKWSCQLMNLFAYIPNDDPAAQGARPLADRMRPRTLDEFVG